MTIQPREVEHVHLPEDDEEVRRPDLVRHRELTPEQWNRFEGYVAEMFGKRFTVQERMGDEIADTLQALISAHGVAVSIEAHHLCTQMRGVRELHPKTRTVVWRGEYAESPQMRNEFFHLTGARSG